MLPDQVDGRHQRLGLDRQQARGAGEGVAVGVRVDLDLVVLGDLRVEDVRARPEVHDVEYLDVLAQLGVGYLKALAHLGDAEAATLAAGLDQDRGERDQAGEALGPDRGLGPPVALRRQPHRSGRVHGGAVRHLDLGLAAVALDQERDALL